MASGYNFLLSAELFTALCCLHNFIIHDGLTVSECNPPLSQTIKAAQLTAAVIEGTQPVMSQSQRKKAGEDMRDKIADEMWRSYQNIMRSRRFPLASVV